MPKYERLNKIVYGEGAKRIPKALLNIDEDDEEDKKGGSDNAHAKGR